MFELLKVNCNNIDLYIDEISKFEKENFYDEAYNKNILKNFLNDYDNFFILLLNNRIIGYIIYRLLDVTHIFKIFIVKEHRGNRYADELFNVLKKDSIKHKINSIYAEVRKNNISAINFYTRNGFVKIDTKKNYYLNPNDDAIIFFKNIS